MTKGNVFTLSTISGRGGGTPWQVWMVEGGTPARSGWWEGVPRPGLDGGGVPEPGLDGKGLPQPGLDGGGVPQVWMVGVPQV